MVQLKCTIIYQYFVAFRAPDGSCLLTCSDDNLLRIFNLPASLYSSVNQCCDEELVTIPLHY